MEGTNGGGHGIVGEWRNLLFLKLVGAGEEHVLFDSTPLDNVGSVNRVHA